MPSEKDIVECSECGLSKGHKLSCVTGNEMARKYQNSLERKHRGNAAKELEEIRDCENCILCENHHAKD